MIRCTVMHTPVTNSIRGVNVISSPRTHPCMPPYQLVPAMLLELSGLQVTVGQQNNMAHQK